MRVFSWLWTYVVHNASVGVLQVGFEEFGVRTWCGQVIISYNQILPSYCSFLL